MNQGPTDPAPAARQARFEALVGRVHEPVQRYVRRRTDPTTADDVVAEALTVLWRRLDDVPSGAELAWAYGVARRCLANARRGDRRRLRLVDRVTSQAQVQLGPVATSPDPADLDHSDPELARAMADLSDDDREVLRLWAWEQLEAREIAAVLDITPNAASIRLHRAKQRLKGLLTTPTSERPAPGPDRDRVEDGTDTEHREETT